MGSPMSASGSDWAEGTIKKSPTDRVWIKHDILDHCWRNVTPPSQSWPTMKPTLGQRLAGVDHLKRPLSG